MSLALLTICILALIGQTIAFILPNAVKYSPKQHQRHKMLVDNSIADITIGWNATFFDHFMRYYWQKRPLLIRKAIPDIEQRLNLSQSDYFSLSQDEDVEVRLIQQASTVNEGKWKKEYGPFDAKRLSSLSTANWTILVQEIDRHIPRVADLWQLFSCIPNWRRDDIMISYSLPGGGIGAHVDNYDVFLIQGSGRREWAIENTFLTERQEKRREIPNMDTRLLRDFTADQKWELEAGDMLYLPPRIPHRGTTLTPLGDDRQGCTTISLGFRSPNIQYLVTAFWDAASRSSLTNDNTFFVQKTQAAAASTDDTIQPAGRIGKQVIHGIKAEVAKQVLSGLRDDKWFALWLGRYLTTPLRYHMRRPRPTYWLPYISPEDTDSQEAVDDSDSEDDGLYPLYLRPSYRIASYRQFSSINALYEAIMAHEVGLRRCEGIRIMCNEYAVFVDGQDYYYPLGLDSSLAAGQVLCDHNILPQQELCKLLTESADFRRLLKTLLLKGYYYPIDFLQ